MGRCNAMINFFYMQQPFLPNLSPLNSVAPDGYFFVRQVGRYEKVCCADLHYVEARRNYSMLQLRERSILALAPLKVVETILPATHFLRIHRGFIVSLDWIQAFDQQVVYGPGAHLPLGDCYRKVFLERVRVVGEGKVHDGHAQADWTIR
jgi:DNA-binding LytR/AlgR family response regulator